MTKSSKGMGKKLPIETVEQWMELAADEGELLMAYNCDREQGWRLGCNELDTIYREFEKFLDTEKPDAAKGSIGILAAFGEKQTDAGSKPRKHPSMRGCPTCCKDALIFLKSAVNKDLARIFYGREDHFQPLAGEIRDLITDADGDWKKEIQAAVVKVASQISRDLTEVENLSRSVTTPHGSPDTSSEMRDRFTEKCDRVWWFTSGNCIDEEERAQAADADFATRSGYVAGMRACLGLADNCWDAGDDVTAAMEGNVAGRIYVQLELSKETAEALEKRQPTTFSGGLPDLFVARAPDPDVLGGQTVRLVRDGCINTDCPSEKCTCASAGVNEGLVWIDELDVNRNGLRYRKAGYLFAEDIWRYQIPDFDQIKGNI